MYTLFKRISRDNRFQKIFEKKVYKRLRSFSDHILFKVGLSITLSALLTVWISPGLVLGALMGLCVGMCVTFGTTFILKHLNTMEENVSFTSLERRQEVETTLHLLEKASEHAHTEVFKNAIKDTLKHLNNPTTSYALWKQVNAYLRTIAYEREVWEARHHKQSQIDVAVQQLNNKLNPPKEHVFKL